MNPFEIRRFRERLGMTQGEFAELVGVCRAQVNRWEKGLAAPSRLGLLRIMDLMKDRRTHARRGKRGEAEAWTGKAVFEAKLQNGTR